MTLCRQPSPYLAVGERLFQGGDCRRRWPHLGAHVNSDGTTWGHPVGIWLVIGAAQTLAVVAAWRGGRNTAEPGW